MHEPQEAGAVAVTKRQGKGALSARRSRRVSETPTASLGDSPRRSTRGSLANGFDLEVSSKDGEQSGTSSKSSSVRGDDDAVPAGRQSPRRRSTAKQPSATDGAAAKQSTSKCMQLCNLRSRHVCKLSALRRTGLALSRWWFILAFTCRRVRTPTI